MLLRHSAYYLLARGIPGFVNFAALAVYTRLLAPDQFGYYSLVLAGVGLVNVVVFQWLRLVIGRFLQSHGGELDRFLSGIVALFLALVAGVTGFGIFLHVLGVGPVWQRLLVLAVLLLLAQAWFELNLSLAAARLQPKLYGRLLGSKAVIALVVGGFLAWGGMEAAAPIVGLFVAYLVAFLLFGLNVWRGVVPRWPEMSLLRSQLRYGLPLTVTFALAWVMNSSDRLIIAWLLDERAVGVYAAGYDIAFQGLTLLLIIINTAAYPLAVTALEQYGVVEARRQLSQNGELIIAASLAGASGLVVMGPQIATLLIGEAFRFDSIKILPWIAVAAALAGIKAYHFDIAFHLGRNSRWLVVTGAIAAIANLVLNLLLIPEYGILGAAWATLGAFGIALLASCGLGSRAFAMPPKTPLLVKGASVALGTAMAASLGKVLSETVWVELGLGVFFGLVAAFLTCLVVNVGGFGGVASRYWKQCNSAIKFKE